MAMCDQLQVAVGLREAVRRWCLPVTNVPATCSGAHAASCCDKQAGAPGVRFLDQLLLLRPLCAAEAPPGAEVSPGNAQYSSCQGITGEASTPNSCSGASTFRSTLGDSTFFGRSRNDERDYSLEGDHLPFHMHGPCSDISTSGSRTLPPAEAPQWPPKAEGVPVARQAKPSASVPHVQQILPTDGPYVPKHDVCTEEKTLGRPSALPTLEKRQERRIAAAASAGQASAATAAAGSTTAERPRRQQHQQQHVQMLWQLRSCATSSLAAKGLKRRPEPLVGPQLLPRGGIQNGPAVAMPSPGGSCSTRAEGPPQKRQAVARRRGDAAPVTRSTSCSSGSSAKTSVPGERSRRDAAAGRGYTAGEGQSTSCRLRLSSNEASAKPKQQPLLQHQQQLRPRQLKAGDSSNSAATHPATQRISGDANKLLGDIACAPSPKHQERMDGRTASGEFGGDDGAANAAIDAIAALRGSSNSSSIDDDPVAAFALEWLLGCEKRLRAAAGPASGTAVSSNMETPKQRATASLSHHGSHSGSSGDLQRLQVTKKRLKQELKAYNSAFATHFGRQPFKQDKEPLRPVYMHYQLIKQMIGQLSPGATEGSITAAADSPSAAPARTPSGAATAAQPDDSSSVTSRKTIESDKGSRKGRSARMKEGRTASRSPTGARRQVYSGGGPRSPVQAKAGERRGSQLTAYERLQQMQQRREEMTAQLNQLQRDRRVLGDKLAAYHQRFKQEHGRPLRLKTDIAPVQHEYNLFVETTKQIDALAYALQKQSI